MAKTISKSVTCPYSTGGIPSARNGGRDYRTIYSNASGKSNNQTDYCGIIPTSEGYSSASYISNISVSYQMRVTNAANEGTIAGNKGYVESTVMVGTVSSGKPFFNPSGNDMSITTAYASSGTTKTWGDRYSTDWKNASNSIGTTPLANDARIGVKFYFKNEYGLYSESRNWVNAVKINYVVNVRNYVSFAGDGITARTDTVNFGDTPSYGSTPSRSGYRFTGWKSSRNSTVYTGTLPTADGYDTTYTAQWVQVFYLDVNGRLDGADSGGLSPYGTCDVYINGSLAANDVSDYWTQHDINSTYEIKDIKANAGYTYEGVVEGSLTGKITAATNIRLAFSSKPYKIFVGSSKVNKIYIGTSEVKEVYVGTTRVF